MKGLFSILITITALSGCATKSESLLPTPVATVNTNVVDTAKGSSPLTYLALGDSYTIGQSVPLAQSFPYQLTAQLGLTTKPTIIAVTGWTTANLLSAITSNTNTYDIVTLLIGVNDQYQGMSAEGYRTRFKQLLESAIKYAKGNKQHVFVLSIPDYGVTPFANGDDSIIGPAIDTFNNVNNAESTLAGVNYLNITTISKQAAIDGSLIAADGLHPSAKMYALWVQQLSPQVKSQFK